MTFVKLKGRANKIQPGVSVTNDFFGKAYQKRDTNSRIPEGPKEGPEKSHEVLRVVIKKF